MGHRYNALRIVANAMKVLGVITAIITVFTALSICGAGAVGGSLLDSLGRNYGQYSGGAGRLLGLFGGLLGSVLPILVGGGLAMFLYAQGEAIYVQIDIEENTRTLAHYLRYQAGPSGSNPAVTSQGQPSLNPNSSAPPPATNQQVLYCPQCGTQVAATDKYCSNCNAALSF